MMGHRAVRSGVALAAATCLVAACGAPEDPFTSGPGHATVAGVVTAANGTAISQTTIRITCARAAMSVVASTDSAGRYVANLETDSDPFEGSNGRLRCHFTEPAPAPARVQIDTSLAFVRGPVLVALQFVDLQEP